LTAAKIKKWLSQAGVYPPPRLMELEVEKKMMRAALAMGVMVLHSLGQGCPPLFILLFETRRHSRYVLLKEKLQTALSNK
jgi:hypothetical protein